MKKVWIVGKNISRKNYSKCVKVDLVPPLWIERGGGSNIYIHQCCRFHLFTCVHIPYTAMPPSHSGETKPRFVRHEERGKVCISDWYCKVDFNLKRRIQRPCQMCLLWAKVSFPPSRQFLILRSLSFVFFLWFPPLQMLLLQSESRRPTNGDLGPKAAPKTETQLKSYKICFHPGPGGPLFEQLRWCFWNGRRT